MPIGDGFRVADARIKTLAAGLTLVKTDAMLQALDPDGSARTVVLPAAAEGMVCIIANTADAAEIITVNDAAAALIGTPTQNETLLCISDGTSWHGLIGLST